MNPNCCLTCPEKEACDDEQIRRNTADETVQIRSTNHGDSGRPVASPNQLN